eukprot:m.137391 g.137391  ORF g.137391 m.137391 type:complete len:134 (+) comp14752_c0_seq7:1182-1583(+)
MLYWQSVSLQSRGYGMPSFENVFVSFVIDELNYESELPAVIDIYGSYDLTKIGSNDFNITNRELTRNFVRWNPKITEQLGDSLRTPNLKPIIDELNVEYLWKSNIPQLVGRCFVLLSHYDITLIIGIVSFYST